MKDGLREGARGDFRRVTWLVRLAAVAGLCVLLALAYLYFSPLLSLVLLGLAVLSGVRPAWGAAVLFAIISVDTVQPLFGSIYVSFSEMELAACLLGWAALRGLEGANWRVLAWGAPFTLAVFISGLVNTPLYKVPPHTLRASELLLALFFASSVVRGPAARKVFAFALVAATVFYSTAGLMQVKTAPDMRVYSFFTNPNQLAGYLILLLPLLAALFLFSGAQRFRPVFAYAGVIGVAALVATFSRGGMAALLVGLALVLAIHLAAGAYRLFRYVGTRNLVSAVLHTPARGGILCLHLILVLTGSLLVVHFVDVQALFDRSAKHLNHRYKETESSPLGNRDFLVKAGVSMWVENTWTGIGPGNYAEAASRYLNDLRQQIVGPLPDSDMALTVSTHNLYIQLLVKYGVLGLAAFLVLMACLFARFIPIAVSSPWALGGLGLLAAFLAHNTVDVTFPSLAREMGLLLGTCITGTRGFSKAP
jgi:O-antigen ligase